MVAHLYSYALETTSSTWPLRQGLILEWNGGFGEIAPLPGFSKETLFDAKKEILSLLPHLDTATPILPSVRFGISSARNSFSLTKLCVPLCLLNESSADFPMLKLKLGHLSVNDAVAYVRSHLGAYRLRLDCNRKWTLDEALFFVSFFQPTDFEYLEEPVSSFSELIQFSKLTQFPIAVDESIHLPYHQIPTLKALVVKPTIIGTIPVSSLPIVLSSSYESSLGLLSIAGLASKNSQPLGLDTFHFFKEDLLIPPLKKEKGTLTWTPSNVFPIDRSKLCLIATAP